MANHKSALKKAKQDLVRRARNRSGKSMLRTALKNFRSAAASGSEKIADQLPKMYALIDTSAKKGIIHRNAAARLKSQLTRNLQKTAT